MPPLFLHCSGSPFPLYRGTKHPIFHSFSTLPLHMHTFISLTTHSAHKYIRHSSDIPLLLHPHHLLCICFLKYSYIHSCSRSYLCSPTLAHIQQPVKILSPSFTHLITVRLLQNIRLFVLKSSTNFSPHLQSASFFARYTSILQ